MPNDYRIKNTIFDEGATTYYNIDNTLTQVDTDTLQKYIIGSMLCFVDTLEGFPNDFVNFLHNENGIVDSITIVLNDSTIYSKSFKNMNEDVVALWYAIQIIHGGYGY